MPRHEIRIVEVSAPSALRPEIIDDLVRRVAEQREVERVLGTLPRVDRAAHWLEHAIAMRRRTSTATATAPAVKQQEALP